MITFEKVFRRINLKQVQTKAIKNKHLSFSDLNQKYTKKHLTDKTKATLNLVFFFRRYCVKRKWKYRNSPTFKNRPLQLKKLNFKQLQISNKILTPSITYKHSYININTIFSIIF